MYNIFFEEAVLTYLGSELFHFLSPNFCNVWSRYASLRHGFKSAVEPH